MVYKKYKFPLQIFFFFEKISPVLWTSKITNANSAYCIVPGSLLNPLSLFLKNELFLNLSYVVDASCIEGQSRSELTRASGKILLFYVFYFIFLKKRITFLFTSSGAIKSIDSIYPSSNWLEREFSEMYGIYFSSKVDSRNLLLDYSLNEAPLLKSYPTGGLREVTYSILAESVIYTTSSTVEL